MRSYERPMVTMVELRIQEAVLTSCKTVTGAYITADNILPGGCWAAATGSATGSPILCSQAGS